VKPNNNSIENARISYRLSDPYAPNPGKRGPERTLLPVPPVLSRPDQARFCSMRFRNCVSTMQRNTLLLKSQCYPCEYDNTNQRRSHFVCRPVSERRARLARRDLLALGSGCSKDRSSTLEAGWRDARQHGPTSAGRRFFRCRRRVSSTGRGLPPPIIGPARKTAEIARCGFVAAAAWHGSSSLP
jgi:hypothetical protein